MNNSTIPSIRFVKQQNVRRRQAGKIANTTFGNELADAIQNMGQVLTMGCQEGYIVGAHSPIFVQITSSSQDGSNKRWKYSFKQKTKTSTGYGGWTDTSGGLTGSSNLFNLIEDQNSSSGQYGNGVTSSNLTGSLDIKPIPNNTILVLVGTATISGTTEYYVQYENGVDGGCT